MSSLQAKNHSLIVEELVKVEEKPVASPLTETRLEEPVLCKEKELIS